MRPPSYLRSVDRNVVMRLIPVPHAVQGFPGSYGYLCLCFYCPDLWMYGLGRPQTTLNEMNPRTRFEPRTSRGRRTNDRSNAIFDSHVHARTHNVQTSLHTVSQTAARCSAGYHAPLPFRAVTAPVTCKRPNTSQVERSRLDAGRV